MVVLRLRRVGRKKQASFRLVATDSRCPRDGRFIEILGHYNPRTNPPTVCVKEERIIDWLSKGATTSDAVRLLLVQQGIWKKYYGTDYKFPAPKAKAVETAAPEAEA